MIGDLEFEYGAQWGQTVEKNFFQLGGFVNNSYLEVNTPSPILELRWHGGALSNDFVYTIL